MCAPRWCSKPKDHRRPVIDRYGAVAKVRNRLLDSRTQPRVRLMSRMNKKHGVQRSPQSIVGKTGRLSKKLLGLFTSKFRHPQHRTERLDAEQRFSRVLCG